VLTGVFIELSITKQIDNFNCGVFLLILIDKLSKARSLAKLKFIQFENNRRCLKEYRLKVDEMFKNNSGI
jgi:hypothetical protein